MTEDYMKKGLMIVPYCRITKENNCVLRITIPCREAFKEYQKDIRSQSYGHALLTIMKEVEYSRKIIVALSEAILNDEKGLDKKGILEIVNRNLTSFEKIYYDYLIERYVKKSQSEKKPKEESRG